MPILLDQLIVPSYDKAAGARFLGELLGVPWEPGAPGDHFAPVYVNDTLTIDFADRERFESHHYCFHVGDAELEAIFGRIKARASRIAARRRARSTCRSTRAAGARTFIGAIRMATTGRC
jgi:hypothetical protein